MQVLGEIIFELIAHLVGRKEAKAGKVFWGPRLTFMGVILTGFAILLVVLFITHGGIVPEMWYAIGPFLIVGIPSLFIGIILLNNP